MNLHLGKGIPTVHDDKSYWRIFPIALWSFIGLDFLWVVGIGHSGYFPNFTTSFSHVSSFPVSATGTGDCRAQDEGIVGIVIVLK